MRQPDVVTITSYEQARAAYRHKELRQALYDAGEVVMADVLVNLHGDAHRARRRLENRLFRRDTQTRYERELFPPIVEHTLEPHLATGRAELVGLSHQMMMNTSAIAVGPMLSVPRFRSACRGNPWGAKRAPVCHEHRL